jgi:hypothetical protein
MFIRFLAKEDELVGDKFLDDFYCSIWMLFSEPGIPNFGERMFHTADLEYKIHLLEKFMHILINQYSAVFRNHTTMLREFDSQDEEGIVDMDEKKIGLQLANASNKIEEMKIKREKEAQKKTEENVEEKEEDLKDIDVEIDMEDYENIEGFGELSEFEKAMQIKVMQQYEKIQKKNKDIDEKKKAEQNQEKESDIQIEKKIEENKEEEKKEEKNKEEEKKEEKNKEEEILKEEKNGVSDKNEEKKSEKMEEEKGEEIGMLDSGERDEKDIKDVKMSFEEKKEGNRSEIKRGLLVNKEEEEERYEKKWDGEFPKILLNSKELSGIQFNRFKPCSFFQTFPKQQHPDIPIIQQHLSAIMLDVYIVISL